MFRTSLRCFTTGLFEAVRCNPFRCMYTLTKADRDAQTYLSDMI